MATLHYTMFGVEYTIPFATRDGAEREAERLRGEMEAVARLGRRPWVKDIRVEADAEEPRA